MKFLPDVSYLSNLFKRKSGMLQTSTDSGLVIPPNTTVITIDEPDSPITLQLLAEQQHHQRSQQLNPRAPLWQRILKATKNNVLQKNQQSKKVKNPRISPRLQPTTATATTCNVSIRFTKDSTSKIEKAVPHQFQIHHINNKLDHKDGDLLNYPSEKLAIPITTTKDHTIITIEPSLEAGPSSAEASGSDSNNGNVFALNSNLASPTMSDTKKENIKVNGLYSSNVWAPKNVKSEEGWRVTLKKQFQKYQYKKQKSRQQQYQQQLPAYGVNGMLCYGSRMKNEALAYNGNGTQFYPVPPTLYPQPPPLAPPHLNQFNQPIPQDPCVQYAPQPMHHPFMLQTAQHHFHPPGLGPYTHAQQFYTASIAHLHVQQSIQPSIIPSCRITPIYDTIPQPVQPHAPQPVSTLAQDLSFEQGREQINQNLRDILHFADQCNAREQERELNHLLRSAKTINPVTTNSQQSNHQVDIELGQQFSDDEEEEDNDDDDEIEDKKGKRTAIRVPFRKPRQILAVNAAYVPSDNPGARSPSGFHKLIDIFQQERTLFMQDLNYYRCTVKKGLPWWDYYRLAIIGDGLCGKVYSAVRLKQADKVHGPKICAIKTLQLVYDDRQNNKKIFESESLLREIYIMTQMRHRNLMRLDEVFVDKNTVYMVMPMMRCSLVNVINSRSEASLAEGYAVYASLEVAKGLNYMHKSGMYHCDIKCDNILVDHKGGIKLADFGLAQDIGPKNYHYCGTIPFMAPEVADEKQSCDQKCDIWSMGITMIEMLDGRVGHYHKNEEKARHILARLQTSPRWSRHPGISANLIRLIDFSLLQISPHHRISAETLVNTLHNLIKKHAIMYCDQEQFLYMMLKDKKRNVRRAKKRYMVY